MKNYQVIFIDKNNEEQATEISAPSLREAFTEFEKDNEYKCIEQFEEYDYDTWCEDPESDKNYFNSQS
jgi:hypothetical protein